MNIQLKVFVNFEIFWCKKTDGFLNFPVFFSVEWVLFSFIWCVLFCYYAHLKVDNKFVHEICFLFSFVNFIVVQ